MFSGDSSQTEELEVAPDNGQPTQVDQMTTQPSAPSNEGQPEESESVQQQPSAPGNGQPDDAKVQAALREYGQLSKVQQEKAEMARELEEARQKAQLYDSIERVAKQSPESYKEALMKFNGYNEQEASQVVAQMQQKGVWQQQPSVTPQATYQPQIDPYTLAQQAVRDELNAAKQQERFFSALPDIHPSKLAPEKIVEVKALVEAAQTVANSRIQQNPSLDFVDETIKAYQSFTGQTAKQVAEANEESRTQGYLEGVNVRASSTVPSKGYTAPANNTYGLSADELATAKEEGYTPEEFAKLKDPVTRVG